MGQDFFGSFEIFLSDNGIAYKRSGNCYVAEESGVMIRLMPLTLFSEENGGPLLSAKSSDNGNTVYLYEDRWFYDAENVRQRLLARMGRFNSIFARKCRVISDKTVRENASMRDKIKSFLISYHSYSYAKCKYRYALEFNGEIVAVATFSYPKSIYRESCGRIFNSYEWIRYASLPSCRVIGGMGRLLKAFINEIADGTFNMEIMSYSDNEWSNGDVYFKLGFKEAGERESVVFYVNPVTFRRYSLRQMQSEALKEDTTLQEFAARHEYVRICNMGSKKFLLQLPYNG